MWRAIARERFFMNSDYQNQLPTRRKKERPKTLEYRLNFGNRIETYDSPIEEHPSTVALPHLPMPGLLLEFSKNVGWEKLSLISWTKRTNIWHNPPTGTVSLKVKLDMNVLVFARMLAKIAHSYIVGEFWIDTFRPMLQDLILGNDKNAAFVVGSEPHLSPPTETFAGAPAASGRPDTASASAPACLDSFTIFCPVMASA
jgi:hypothetical protein